MLQVAPSMMLAYFPFEKSAQHRVLRNRYTREAIWSQWAGRVPDAPLEKQQAERK
jgi:hypothetical protein